MKWGLMTRAETNRGLGVLGRDMHEFLEPDRTAVVVITDYSFPGNPEVIKHQFEQPLTGLEGATVLQWPHPAHPLYQFDRGEFEAWARGLDIVVMLETPYDPRCFEWLKLMGIQTVLYGMPEMTPHTKAREEQWTHGPDTYWWPTTWVVTDTPPGTTLHVPVRAQEFVTIPEIGAPINIIHVGGKEALGDRNGTHLFPNVVRTVRNGNKHNRLTVYSQTTNLPVRQGMLPVSWEKGPADKADMYTTGHVHVMPRRYAGLCLPAQESLSYGLGLVMTDTSPNNDGHWPCDLIPCESSREHWMPCGNVTTYDCTAVGLTSALGRLCNEPGYAQGLMRRGREWAERNTWEARRGDFYSALTDAAS